MTLKLHRWSSQSGKHVYLDWNGEETKLPGIITETNAKELAQHLDAGLIMAPDIDTEERLGDAPGLKIIYKESFSHRTDYWVVVGRTNDIHMFRRELQSMGLNDLLW